MQIPVPGCNHFADIEVLLVMFLEKTNFIFFFFLKVVLKAWNNNHTNYDDHNTKW